MSVLDILSLNRKIKLPALASSNGMREAMEVLLGQRGDKVGDVSLDAAVTFRDLINGDVIGINVNGQTITNPGGSGSITPGSGATDLTPPPAPESFTVTGGFANVYLEWAGTSFTGYAGTEIWRASVNNISQAIKIDETTADIYVDTVGNSFQYFYWIRFVKNAGNNTRVTGAYFSQSGTSGQTSPDPAYIMSLLAGADQTAIGNASDNKPFYYVASPTVINGVPIPVGLYMKTTFIIDASITNAKIKDEAVDNSKIANLSAAKLTAGDGTIGGNLKSSNYAAGNAGWIVTPGGLLEASNAVIRGTIFASAGAIGGSYIGSNYMQSTNWIANSQGWRFNSDGTGYIGGIYIASTGIRSANYAAGSAGFALNADGSMEIGNAAVRGSLDVGTSGNGWQYMRTNNKWYGDGVDGFVTARNAATGQVFMEARFGSTLQRMSNFDNFVLLCPGMSIVNGVLTINQVNVIDTLNIRGNAITSALNSSASQIHGTGPLTASITGNFENQPVCLMYAYKFYDVSGDPGTIRPHYLITIRRDGITLYTTDCYSSESDMFIDTPSAGNHTYSITVTYITLPDTFQRLTIFALHTKR